MNIFSDFPTGFAQHLWGNCLQLKSKTLHGIHVDCDVCKEVFIFIDRWPTKWMAGFHWQTRRSNNTVLYFPLFLEKEASIYSRSTAVLTDIIRTAADGTERQVDIELGALPHCLTPFSSAAILGSCVLISRIWLLFPFSTWLRSMRSGYRQRWIVMLCLLAHEITCNACAVSRVTRSSVILKAKCWWFQMRFCREL